MGLLQRWFVDSGFLALTAINGLPGIGKTALALLLAHKETVRSEFTDGILWVDLGPEPGVFSLLGQ